MEYEEIRAWQRIFRDFVIVLLGAFMLVYETVVSLSPNPYLIGAGLTALGMPPAFRIDEERRSRKSRRDSRDYRDNSEDSDDNEDGERWSHLP